MTRLNEWLYEMLSRLCADRGNFCACYVPHRDGLKRNTRARGKHVRAGIDETRGIKGNQKAIGCWRRHRQTDLMDSNLDFPPLVMDHRRACVTLWSRGIAP
jgi:hypothetical protein